MSLEDFELPRGMVYMMTNSASENEIAAFRRFDNGTLAFRIFYPTGGQGTGPSSANGIDPLVSQGSLILSHRRRFLFAVNAGSNTITSFRVMQDGGLVRVSVVNSGGVRPNSLTIHRNILYVTNSGNQNQGAAANITGFHVDRCGVLTLLPDSTRPLSTAYAQPACILFSPNGNQLVVSELANNRLTVFSISSNGYASLQYINTSYGTGPFGMSFRRDGLLLVAEAGANALSSYRVNSNGTLSVVSGSVSTGQSATCWVSLAKSGRHAYTSNTGSRTISTFRVSNSGVLSFVRNTYSTPEEADGGAPIDNAISTNGRYFYALNGNEGTVSAFKICDRGVLARIQVTGNEDIPIFGTQGLAVI